MIKLYVLSTMKKHQNFFDIFADLGSVQDTFQITYSSLRLSQHLVTHSSVIIIVPKLTAVCWEGENVREGCILMYIAL